MTDDMSSTATAQTQSQPSAAAPITLSTTDLPPTPNPSSDNHASSNSSGNLSAKLASSSSSSATASHDLNSLPPLEALKLLGAGVELLVRITGDIPPTPPPKTPTDPQMSGMLAEKESILRSYSDKNLSRLRQQQQQSDLDKAKGTPQIVKTDGGVGGSASGNQVGMSKLQEYNAAMAAQLMAQQAALHPTSQQTIDGVHLKQDSQQTLTSPTSPTGPEPEPFLVVGADSQPLNLQHGAITRKFYSKKEPPISIQQYLLRLHQFCPMSTAVYLATSLYIHRLAVEERMIPVTRRNAHRLVLAGLRVAMKALEDLSYPHGKVAKVGGVSEMELARLEISFCFLAGFELVVGEAALTSHWETLRQEKASQSLSSSEVPTLRLGRRPREVPTT